MRFHLFGLASAPVSPEFCCSPFTALIHDMAVMVVRAGHELVLYGAAGSTAPCTEFVELVSTDTLKHAFTRGQTNPLEMKWENCQDSIEWKEYVTRGTAELRQRYCKGDIALITYGYFQAFVAEEAELHCEIVCGYSGVFTPHKVFPSYAWMHYLYGEMKKCTSGDWFDVVIPHYIDTDRFPCREQKDGYLLFLGRLNVDKGPDIAIDIAVAAGKRIVLAGTDEAGGIPDWLSVRAKPGFVEFVGRVGHEERVKLLAGADALLCPVRWMEAFGMTTIEAFACNTPVISSDWGAFTETIIHGVNGFRCRDKREFVKAVHALPTLHPFACRHDAETRFGLSAVWPRYAAYFLRLQQRIAAGWEEIYDGGWRGTALPHIVRHYCKGETLRGVEVGVARGELSRALLREVPNLHLTMVDSWAVEPAGSRYRTTGDPCGSLTSEQVRKDKQLALANTRLSEDRRTVLPMESAEASEHVQDGSQDFVFIDAGHWYEAVQRDLELWARKVRAGGVLAGHDFGRASVPDNGVQKAVLEFCKDKGLTLQRAADWVWFCVIPEAIEGCADESHS